MPLVLALALGSLHAATVSPIKHVVVLYEENRAFDHIFGHNKKLKAAGADCLTGDESNPRSLTDPSKGRVKVIEGAPYVATIDPNHGRCRHPSLPLQHAALSLSLCLSLCLLSPT